MLIVNAVIQRIHRHFRPQLPAVVVGGLLCSIILSGPLFLHAIIVVILTYRQMLVVLAPVVILTAIVLLSSCEACPSFSACQTSSLCFSLS